MTHYLVKKAEGWPWSSLYLRLDHPELVKKLLTPWPIDMPKNYINLVNEPLPKPQLQNIRTSIEKSRPLGSEVWVQRQADKFDLGYTLRKRGRLKE